MHLGLGDSSAAAGVCLPQIEALPTLVALRSGCVFTGNVAQQQGGAVAVQSGVLLGQARTIPSVTADPNPNNEKSASDAPTPARPHSCSVICWNAECRACRLHSKLSAAQGRFTGNTNKSKTRSNDASKYACLE